MVVVDLVPGLVLVTGPSRSGKSRWAEHLVQQQPEVTYIATSAPRPNDERWQQRIARHQQRRPEHWSVVECGADLSGAMHSIPPNQTLLIDALGGFTASHLDLDADEWLTVIDTLLRALSERSQPVVIVIEETGWGVVPATAIGGTFRDRQGELAQVLERHADASWLVVQGRAVDLHSIGVAVPQ